MASLSFLVLLLLPFSLLAQTHTVGGECDTLELHSPRDDVAYQAGVDASGWAVAPADLGDAAIDAAEFDAVTLRLNLPAANFSDNPVLNNQFPFAELNVGEMVINQHEPSTFNGKPFGNTEIIPNPDCE